MIVGCGGGMAAKNGCCNRFWYGWLPVQLLKMCLLVVTAVAAVAAAAAVVVRVACRFHGKH